MKTNKPPIAVVGMAGVFPGASDLSVFWQKLTNKIEAVAQVPPQRWIAPPSEMVASWPAPDKAFHHRACLVRDFRFDPSGLDLDAALLRQLDPLYHLTLHTGRAALADCRMENTDGKRVGVSLAAIALPTDGSSAVTREIFGCDLESRIMGSELSKSQPLTREKALAARVTGLPGAILARALGLGGGSFTLDAACASSLYAVKLACDELQAGRADAMLAGGVSRPECLYTQVGFSQLRALSLTGRCAPFDRSADGLVVGEGAGILVLKRLEDAVKAGDQIYAVIRGIGLSNDMRGNLLAPDTRGQVRAMQAAYASAGWSPADAELIECHGAGTPVGDMTELTSLRTLWQGIDAKTGTCPIGSVKSAIGHLLTAAGAAGMIKVLLGVRHKVLPPSLNFEQAPPESPLHGSPFRVQSQPEAWAPKQKDEPRRAGVSAFGFGGINAHLLFEEFSPETYEPKAYPSPHPQPPEPIAIVGMETVFGDLKNRREFQEAVFRGESAIKARPDGRWKGADAIGKTHLNGRAANGAYIEQVSLRLGEFNIPPKEIPDILPQQLLMLKAAAGAMQDAGLPLRGERESMGVIIGMDFDLEATHFHLRWNLYNQVRQWKGALQVDDAQAEAWLQALRDGFHPPLNAPRTLGALGGIVASRIAREFRFGGPSFVVSAEEAAGIRALEIGVRELQAHEAKAVLVGAVDLAGDLRLLAIQDRIRRFSEHDKILPFDWEADGTLPGEGAVALVVKRLSDAKKDGDRIYATIKGLGHASGGGIDQAPEQSGYQRAMELALEDAGVLPETLGYIEAHASGEPDPDRLEAEALNRFFSPKDGIRAVGSLKPVVGHTGAAAGLASVAKTALSLYHAILPPVPGFTQAKDNIWDRESFYLPIAPQFWLRNRADGPRRAGVSAMTPDGNYAHVILEEYEFPASEPLAAAIQQERKRPLGLASHGLFAVQGADKAALLGKLDGLAVHVRDQDSPEQAARSWYESQQTDERADPLLQCGLAIVSGQMDRLPNLIAEARQAVLEDRPKKIRGSEGICYFPSPLGLEKSNRIAFVFPGSGNHYLGMGRGIGLVWPEILRKMDAQTPELERQMLPGVYMPRRIAWEPGWESKAQARILADPLHMIYGQVVHGGLMADLVRHFGVNPDAVIGYSLGESAGLFALGAWPERGEMLARMEKTDLFSQQLAGPCLAARKAWDIGPDQELDWAVAVVNRPAAAVREQMADRPLTRLLIVNTPDECVIGGDQPQVAALIRDLGCEAIYLQGVVTVHCDAARPVAEAYRALHLFPTTPPPGIRFYSCALGRTYPLSQEAAADSILNQALHGFDFPGTIKQAYADGVRIFLEMGPQASCTRMIRRILKDRPHQAVSACVRGEEDHLTVLKFLGTLIGERVPVDLAPLYGKSAWPAALNPKAPEKPMPAVTVPVGGKPADPPPPPKPQGSEISRKEIPPDQNQGQNQGQNQERNQGRNQEQNQGRNQGQNQARQPVAQGAPSPQQSPSAQAHRQDQKELPVGETPSESVLSDFPGEESTGFFNPFAELMEPATRNMEATAQAHQAFLQFSRKLSQGFANGFEFQNQLIESMIGASEGESLWKTPDPPDFSPNESYGPAELTDSEAGAWQAEKPPLPPENAPSLGEPLNPNRPGSPEPAFPRESCMEFAIGSVAKVLGPEFAVVDRYPARVRLPDAPLMLVDRILRVEGEKASLTSGRVVTEHDVLPGAWYLDGDRAPVCISVEAGQADLFLCSYLGIDLAVKGKRTYRLLDAKVRFHRGLPRPGEVIRYDIRIEKFIRQGETWMFFFAFEGTINGQPLISMRNGCAGFFTDQEVKNSGGIILGKEEKAPVPGKKDFDPLVSLQRESYDQAQVDRLRAGDLAAAFGPEFSGIRLPESMRLPGGRMRLIHRVLELDPQGGRYGMGIVRAEADISPDDWFLTCHFVDDRVMPGTLMYECCAHTLRVLLQRIGWVTDKPGVCYEPVIGQEAVLKCRGPVTPETAKVRYEVEIKAIGYGPEPYVLTDALMYADGHRIVQFSNMSMKLTGLSRQEIEAFWEKRAGQPEQAQAPVTLGQSEQTEDPAAPAQPDQAQYPASPGTGKPAIFDRHHILAFAQGKPSEAFGAPYQVFDRERVIARLPRPPYSFLDRVVSVEPEPWVLKADGWIEAEFDMAATDWYFKADRSGAMPFCVLLEIALQPCGWLAAYCGSALRSQKDLKFRNLGGKAVLHRNIHPQNRTLTVQCRMSKVSEAGEMIIENFDMRVLQGQERIYAGETYFGFFTQKALAQQIGLRGAKESWYQPSPEAMADGRTAILEQSAPLDPADPNLDPAPLLAMPSKALLMIDRIDCFIPDGGPHGLGFVRGSKAVDPNEWFFQAHFYQDPVCPGSLGIESFLQLLKYLALQRWPHLADSHRFEILTGKSHEWSYRGQILRDNQKVTVEAAITEISESPVPKIVAQGYLMADGRFIYHMKEFGIELVPVGGNHEY